MPEYKLYFSTTASTMITVEADNLDEAIDQAYNETPHGVCAQCSGWGNNGRPGIELSDVWELDDTAAYTDYPEVAS